MKIHARDSWTVDHILGEINRAVHQTALARRLAANRLYEEVADRSMAHWERELASAFRQLDTYLEETV